MDDLKAILVIYFAAVIIVCIGFGYMHHETLSFPNDCKELGKELGAKAAYGFGHCYVQGYGYPSKRTYPLTNGTQAAYGTGFGF